MAPIRHEVELEDGRLFTLTYRQPGTWFLQGFLNAEDTRTDRAAGEPLMATAGEVPSGADFLTLAEGASLLAEWVPKFLGQWDDTRTRLGR